MSNYKTREEIPTKYTWNLESIFSTIEEWKKAFDTVEVNIDKLKTYKGRLSDESNVLLEFLELETITSELFERIAVFARMKEHENTKDSQRQTLVQRVSPLRLKFTSAISFFSSEILTITNEKWDEFYKNEKLLFYKKALDEVLRGKAHVLSQEKEEVLSQTALLYSADDTFQMLDNADLMFDDIVDTEGKKLPLNNSNYSVYLTNKDRDIRKQAFENLYKAYDGVKNTLASTMLGNLNKDKFYSNIRNYEGSLEKALFDDNISKDIYLNLISTVHNNLPQLHQYVELRKKVLGYKELHTYDMYVELFDVEETKISYEEAYEIMIDALSVLGEDYIDLLKKAHDNRWIDVYPTEGKMGGAYSWGVYKKPFVLLNHTDDLNSLFTLVHEMGLWLLKKMYKKV